MMCQFSRYCLYAVIAVAGLSTANAEVGREDPTQPYEAKTADAGDVGVMMEEHRLLGIYRAGSGKKTVFIDHERLRLRDRLPNGDSLVEIGHGYVVLEGADGKRHRVTLLNLVKDHE